MGHIVLGRYSGTYILLPPWLYSNNSFVIFIIFTECLRVIKSNSLTRLSLILFNNNKVSNNKHPKLTASLIIIWCWYLYYVECSSTSIKTLNMNGFHPVLMLPYSHVHVSLSILSPWTLNYHSSPLQVEQFKATSNGWCPDLFGFHCPVQH